MTWPGCGSPCPAQMASLQLLHRPGCSPLRTQHWLVPLPGPHVQMAGVRVRVGVPLLRPPCSAPPSPTAHPSPPRFSRMPAGISFICSCHRRSGGRGSLGSVPSADLGNRNHAWHTGLPPQRLQSECMNRADQRGYWGSPRLPLFLPGHVGIVRGLHLLGQDWFLGPVLCVHRAAPRVPTAAGRARFPAAMLAAHWGWPGAAGRLACSLWKRKRKQTLLLTSASFWGRTLGGRPAGALDAGLSAAWNPLSGAIWDPPESPGSCSLFVREQSTASRGQDPRQVAPARVEPVGLRMLPGLGLYRSGDSAGPRAPPSPPSRPSRGRDSLLRYRTWTRPSWVAPGHPPSLSAWVLSQGHHQGASTWKNSFEGTPFFLCF